ncbi:response regulator transcription factor [Flavivirga sp. Y03]|uniref:Response regulator transcription factor n=2 Tax=Flavivirga algicola TaxID=2729136 RepID=A0ABX1S1G6_9FLAO|nr:response regulator transcription factor [Flavivirga algicola]
MNTILVFLLLILTIYIFSFKVTHKKKGTYELSKQELNVKKLILEGKSNKDIADNLFISLSTVKTHITNIYSKLNVSNRTELISKFKN